MAGLDNNNKEQRKEINMPHQVPAFRGKFGSTEYFVVTMRAGELVNQLTIPKDMKGWEDQSLEERFQRDVNYRRVRDHIAPYFAQDEDRFIGSFIVTILNDEDTSFRSLEDAGTKFPRALSPSLLGQFGILDLSGGELLVPLDGQHRLAGLRFAIEGRDQLGREIKGLEANADVASDVCTVIMVRDDPEKSRKIFNKVNRYARATSKADNLITADDDFVAVLCREEIVGKLIDPRLVNVRANTLTKKSGMFTTLGTIYEISMQYIETVTGSKPETTRLPSLSDQRLWRECLVAFWNEFLEVEAYRDSLMEPGDSGDQRRAEIREEFVPCRPIVQRALAEALCLCVVGEDDGITKRGVGAAVRRVNKLPRGEWGQGQQRWQGVLMNGDRVITGKTAMRFAARVLAYFLGLPMEEVEVNALRKDFERNTGGKRLADPLPE